MTTRRHLGLSFAAALLLSGAGAGFARAAIEDDDLAGPPNVFISPAGKPFRAHLHQPYPVIAWFHEADKNGDGKLDRDEFIADAAAFFTVLDLNGDGVLDNYEISHYEHAIAPEVLGARVTVGDLRGPGGLYGGRLWRAQIDGTTPVVPPMDPPDPSPPHDIDESGQGASPFGFFAEPEPVMAADEDLNGRIKKAAFLRLAGRHFDQLDGSERGYLTLDKLPKTGIQLRLARYQRH
jgi:hypothetical protein